MTTIYITIDEEKDLFRPSKKGREDTGWEESENIAFFGHIYPVSGEPPLRYLHIFKEIADAHNWEVVEQSLWDENYWLEADRR